ncbi:MAG: hypothetical protein V4692_11395 [Bdellovibrionota bacterium]
MDSMDAQNRYFESQDDIMVPVPLPTEIPQPPNLSSLPARILHSGTVETLIGQNEDLMARLKVNIRRNSILEQDLMDQERVVEDLGKTNRSLVAQLEVLEEKDRYTREKSQAFQTERRDLLEEIELLKTKLEAAEERRDELQAGLRFEESYRRRIQSWVRPMIDRLKTSATDAENKLKMTDRQLATREATIGDLQARLFESVERVKALHADTSADQSRLVEQYETKTQLLERELARARSEMKISIEKAARFEQAISAQAELENKVIELERKGSNSHTAIAQLEAQTERYRKEAKALAAELMESRNLIESSMNEKVEIKDETDRMKDQLESLQAVWNETQKQLETSRLQNEALGKLNQELSRQLANQRKNGIAAAEAAPMKSTVDRPTAERLGKIDSLLAEIESGFTASKDFALGELEFSDEKNSERELGA